jgi:hypothetical protein
MPELVSTATPDDSVTRLMNEGAIGMTQAAKLVGTFRDGKATCSTTITRWVQKGIRLAGGRVLKLEAFRLNGRLCTSKAALIRFIQAQNENPANGQPAAIVCETVAQKKSRSHAASAELDAALAAG